MSKSNAVNYAIMDSVSKLARQVGEEINANFIRHNTKVAAWLSLAEMALQRAYQEAGNIYFDTVEENKSEFTQEFERVYGEAASAHLKEFMKDYDVELKHMEPTETDLYEQDLPKNCLECSHFGGDPGLDCKLISRCFSNYATSRPRMCPLAVEDEDTRENLEEQRDRRVSEQAAEATYDLQEDLEGLASMLDVSFKNLNYKIG